MLLFLLGSWLMVCNVYILQSEGGGAYTRDKLPMQELELKMQGGGGVIVVLVSRITIIVTF